MKKLTKKGLIVCALSVSMLAFANDVKHPVKEKEPKVTSLNFAKVNKGSMLLIKDYNGLVLYKEAIQETGKYSKGFDLTSLPNGEYYFELDTELEIVVIPFDVESSEVNFQKENKTTIFKPMVRVKDDKVFVSRTSFESAPMDFKIYYALNSDVVLSEKFENEPFIERVYDFSGSKKGEYLFVFRSNGRKYIKSIEI
ncbi:MAG: hypothetical protein WBV45_06755 [Lutimonas sp.]